MKKTVSLIILSIFVCASTSVWAQTNSGKSWSLQECIEYGIKHNLQIQGASIDVETNQVTKKQTKMNQLPTLNGSFGQSVNWGRSIDPATNGYNTERFISNNLGLNSSVTLFNGLQLRNRLKQVQYDLESAQLGLKSTENDVKLNIVTAYLNSIYNQELVSVAQSELVSIRKQLERTKALVEAGVKPRTDLLDMESRLATQEADLVRNQNGLSNALLSLKQAMQLPASDNVQIIVPNVNVEAFSFDGSSAEQIYARALLTQPEIKQSELNVSSAESQRKQRFGEFLPSVTLSGYVGTNYSDATKTLVGKEAFVIPVEQRALIGFVDNDPTKAVYQDGSRYLTESTPVGEQYDNNLRYNISLSVNIPIFNNYRSRANYQRSKLQIKRAELQKEQVSNQLRQQIEQAHNDAQASLKLYQSALKQVASLEETFKAADKRYNLGAVSFVDYQVAQSNYLVAQSRLIQAKYDYIFKTKVLDFYLGKPLTF